MNKVCIYIIILFSVSLKVSAQENNPKIDLFFSIIDNNLKKLITSVESINSRNSEEVILNIISAKKEYDLGIEKINEKLYIEKNSNTELLFSSCSGQESDKDNNEEAAIRNMLEKYYLMMFYEEGYCYFAFNWEGYTKLIAPKLNSGQLKFIELYAVHYSKPVVSDAAIIISPKELSQRITEWNEVLNCVSDSLLKNEARIEMYGYIELLLLGTDNTPSFKNNKLDKGVRQSIEELIKNNPEFESVQIIKKFYTNLKKNNFKYSSKYAKELTERLIQTSESIFR